MGLVRVLKILEGGQQLPRLRSKRPGPDPVKSCNDDPLPLNMRSSLADVPLHHVKLGLSSGHFRTVAACEF
jgi:hypothetical protein